MQQNSLPVLRPMRMGELLDQALRLYRKNFFTFIGIIALVDVPVNLLTMLGTFLAFGSLARPETTFLDANYFAGLGLTLLSAVLSGILVQGLGTAALTRAIADNYLGKPTGIFEAYRRVGKSWLTLLGALLLGGLIYIGCIFAMMIPCVGWVVGPGLMIFMAMVVLRFIAPVVVFEKSSVTVSLRRAWDLCRRRFWWLFGYILILSLFSMLIITGPSYLVRYLVTLIGGVSGSVAVQLQWQTVAQTAATVITSLLYLPIQLTAITLAYIDLRVRTEGFDLALLTVEASGETGVEATTQAPVVKETKPFITWQDVGYFASISVGIVAIYFLLVAVLFGIGVALLPPPTYYSG